jgi:hypothetical protein
VSGDPTLDAAIAAAAKALLELPDDPNGPAAGHLLLMEPELAHRLATVVLGAAVPVLQAGWHAHDQDLAGEALAALQRATQTLDEVRAQFRLSGPPAGLGAAVPPPGPGPEATPTGPGGGR